MHIKKMIFYAIGSLRSKKEKINKKEATSYKKIEDVFFYCLKAEKEKKLNEINFLKSYFVTASLLFQWSG